MRSPDLAHAAFANQGGDFIWADAAAQANRRHIRGILRQRETGETTWRRGRASAGRSPRGLFDIYIQFSKSAFFHIEPITGAPGEDARRLSDSFSREYRGLNPSLLLD